MKTKELVKFDIETAVITALDAEYKEVQKIIDVKSKAIVAEGRRQYRELRLAVVAGHSEEKREALDHCQFLDAEKRRILTLLTPGESHLNNIWQAHKDEQDRKEKQRVGAIQAKINVIRNQVVHNVNSATMKESLVILQAQKITKDVYMEFTDQAIQIQEEAIIALTEAYNERLQFEKEEAERKVEAERLEKQRKEQEAAQAKIDEGSRKVREGIAKLEADRKTAEQTKEREEFERQTKIKAEADAKENARQKAEEAEALAAVEAKEKARQEALKPDKSKMEDFANYLQESIQYPELRLDEFKDLLKSARTQIYDIGNEILEALEG